MKLKGMDLLCASPSSTAVISCTDAHRSSTVRRTHVPCSSHIPINQKPKSYFQGVDTRNDDVVRTKGSVPVELNDLYTTTGSSKRQLLHENDTPFIDWDSRSDQIAPFKSSSSRPRNQVVVLRVSLHCKGCAAKVSKHISKMEGVRSFSIDIETKRVTIMGDVTPLGVLASVSKVKNAQFWPSPSSSSSMPLSPWST